MEGTLERIDDDKLSSNWKNLNGFLPPQISVRTFCPPRPREGSLFNQWNKSHPSWKDHPQLKLRIWPSNKALAKSSRTLKRIKLALGRIKNWE